MDIFSLFVGVVVGAVVCSVFHLVIVPLLKPSEAQKIKTEFDRQVAQAIANRSSLPPVNPDRISKVFSRPKDIELPAKPPRDDEPTGEFIRRTLAPKAK